LGFELGFSFKMGWMGASRSCIGRRFFWRSFLGAERVISGGLKSVMALLACREPVSLEGYYRRERVLHVWFVASYIRF
jgi:hypothetical protein